MSVFSPLHTIDKSSNINYPFMAFPQKRVGPLAKSKSSTVQSSQVQSIFYNFKTPNQHYCRIMILIIMINECKRRKVSQN